MAYGLACGHSDTLRAGREILENGGNAVDAATACLFSSFVAEPCMSSPGGGGFSLLRKGNQTLFYDYFCQTPKLKIPPSKQDFFPITVDFGGTQEDFYVGTASIAVPGMVAGIFKMHNDYGSIPIKELAHYAITLAKNGCVIDPFQHHDFQLLERILNLTDEGKSLFFAGNGTLKEIGDSYKMHQMADFLEVLTIEGQRFFYEGEIAKLVSSISSDKGGHLSVDDFKRYQVDCKMLQGVDWNQGKIYSVEDPSIGGHITTLLLKEMEHVSYGHDYEIHMAEAIEKIYKLSKDGDRLREELAVHGIFSTTDNAIKRGGTTHFNIVDNEGMSISVTVSNGEGSGVWVPGTEVQLNNMLGEEALMPDGFNTWKEDKRLMSMMSPTIVDYGDDQTLILGTGGAGRIPYMVAQVVHNIFSRGMSLSDAINHSRMFYHDDILEIESLDFDMRGLKSAYNNWGEPNMYFGGVHSILYSGSEIEAIGDHRRYGHAYVGG